MAVGLPPAGTPSVGTAERATGGVLSAVDIANLGRDAGWRDDTWPNDPEGRKHSELAWAVAIALAESGGDQRAVGRTGGAACGEYVIGLWQICRPTVQTNLFDGATNARTAYAMYVARGKRFGGGLFSTFPEQARGKLSQAEAAVKGTHHDRPGITRPSTWPGFEEVGGVFKFVGTVAEAIGFLVGWITDGQTWIRLGETVGGAILILLGLYLLYVTTKGGTR